MSTSIKTRADKGELVVSTFSTKWNKTGLLNISLIVSIPVIFLSLMNIFFFHIFPAMGEADLPNEAGLGVMLFFLSIEVFLLGFFMTNLFNLFLNFLGYFKVIDPIALESDSYIGQSKGFDIVLHDSNQYDVSCCLDDNVLQLKDIQKNDSTIDLVSLRKKFKIKVLNDTEIQFYRKDGLFYHLQFDKKVTDFYQSKLLA